MIQSHNCEPQNFLLVGNGSYQNRGCEAIVRGTMAVLRREFGSSFRAVAGVYAGAQELLDQNATELDSGLSSFRLESGGHRWSSTWWTMQANKRLGTSFAAQHAPLKPHLRGGVVALEVGGDNYSLDYGRPEVFLAMDRFLQSRDVPVVLWCASVGSFDADPVFAPRIFDHLRTLKGVFVRESESREYLKANGVEENVQQVADPAFVMEPVEPPAQQLGFVVPVGALGLNLSPLIARFFTGSRRQIWEMTHSDLAPWLEFCVQLVKSLAETTQRPILLVPHVGASLPNNDDHSFLEAVRQQVNGGDQMVMCLPRDLNAAEIKWAIARCAVFAGARTHSTIAALSSGVPTLSIGYSLKARGINRDIFGNLDYCVNAAELAVPVFTERLVRLLAQEAQIRELLRDRIPLIKAAAFRAGPLLRQIISRAETA